MIEVVCPPTNVGADRPKRGTMATSCQYRSDYDCSNRPDPPIVECLRLQPLMGLVRPIIVRQKSCGAPTTTCPDCLLCVYQPPHSANRRPSGWKRGQPNRRLRGRKTHREGQICRGLSVRATQYSSWRMLSRARLVLSTYHTYNTTVQYASFALARASSKTPRSARTSAHIDKAANNVCAAWFPSGRRCEVHIARAPTPFSFFGQILCDRGM